MSPGRSSSTRTHLETRATAAADACEDAAAVDNRLERRARREQRLPTAHNRPVRLAVPRRRLRTSSQALLLGELFERGRRQRFSGLAVSAGGRVHSSG
jgi:hypothetical protein